MIADVFIKRPVTAIVISIVLLVVGSICILNLSVGQYPEITPPIVQVTGQFTGADALTVEQTMATPIETQINGSQGMEYLQSNSTNNGALTINATFNIGTDINIATLDVQNRVSIATPQLPDVVKRLGLTVRKRNPSILMLVAPVLPKRHARCDVCGQLRQYLYARCLATRARCGRHFFPDRRTSACAYG